MMKKLSIQINHRSIGFFCSDEALVVRIDLKQNSMIIYITQGQPAQRAKKQLRGRGPRSVEPSIFGNYITISYALNSVTDRPLLFKLYVCWLNFFFFFFAFSLTPLDKLLQRYDEIGFLEL